ncbi:MAG: hypothetical protein DI547_03885 [Sphingobium sp.]|jgi:hypothetical protein|nr:MAG: hypothetical protein DI547_03885 [Sphingobium sp.]
MTGALLKAIRAGWPLLLLVVPAALPAQTQRQRDIRDRWYDPDEARPRGAVLLRSEMLRAHNDARDAVGVPPIGWSEKLAVEAQGYARVLARTRTFRHSDKATRSAPQGENLWMGSTGAFTYAEMAGSWIAERRYYRPRAVIPDISTTGDWRDAGHYTQAIWRGTTLVGCGLASNGDDDYLVCRYSPPGNVFGRNATAVDPAAAPPPARKR